MKKWTIGAKLTVSIYTEIEAETEEKAIAEAETRAVQALCYQCANGDASSEWSLTGELDGEPYDLEVDK